MINDWTYFRFVHTLDAFLWGGELIGEENLPEAGPAVFISNHLGPTGPIAVICSIPLRLYPWVIADMMIQEKAAQYLNWDFVERTLKLKPPLSLKVASLLSRLTVPMLASFGGVPAFQGYEDIHGALEKSIELLAEGKCIFICPENNKLPMDSATQMTPFKKGFARLGELFHARTNQCLNFYPVTVHESRKIVVEKPIIFNPLLPYAQERLRIKNLLESSIRRKYLEIAMGGYLGVTQPH
jgi:hypothetical protein